MVLVAELGARRLVMASPGDASSKTRLPTASSARTRRDRQPAITSATSNNSTRPVPANVKRANRHTFFIGRQSVRIQPKIGYKTMQGSTAGGAPSAVWSQCRATADVPRSRSGCARRCGPQRDRWTRSVAANRSFQNSFSEALMRTAGPMKVAVLGMVRRLWSAKSRESRPRLKPAREPPRVVTLLASSETFTHLKEVSTGRVRGRVASPGWGSRVSRPFVEFVGAAGGGRAHRYRRRGRAGRRGEPRRRHRRHRDRRPGQCRSGQPGGRVGTGAGRRYGHLLVRHRPVCAADRRRRAGRRYCRRATRIVLQLLDGACSDPPACSSLTATPTPISQIDTLGYSVYRSSGTSYPTFNIEVLSSGSGGYTSFVFIPTASLETSNEWQTWNPMDSGPGNVVVEPWVARRTVQLCRLHVRQPGLRSSTRTRPRSFSPDSVRMSGPIRSSPGMSTMWSSACRGTRQRMTSNLTAPRPATSTRTSATTPTPAPPPIRSGRSRPASTP